MKALVKQAAGAGNVSLLEVEEPKITRPDEVKIAVKAAGLCGTDLEILNGRDAMFRPPVIFGHEYCGQVVEAGREVTLFKVGDRVVFEPTVRICEECRYCREGRPNLCSSRLIAGFNTPGGFAEYAVRRQRFVHRLPDRVGFLAGAVCEPLAVATHAVLELTPPVPGDVVVIFGPGAIGLMALQLVKSAGARPIMVGTGKDKSRLQLAGKLGAELAIDIDKEKETLSRLVQERTAGYGADVVIGCAGDPGIFGVGIDLLRKGGRLMQIGLFTREVPFFADKMAYRELILQGSFGHKYSAWKKALALLEQGLVNTEPLVTALPLSQWEKGFQLAESKQALKVVFEPGK
jgi:L-iditol 2-dehydrogenase